MKKTTYFILITVILIVAILANLEIHLKDIVVGLPNIATFFDEAIPPNTKVLHVGLQALFETLQIAFVGTALGAAIALPLSTLGARNLFAKPVVVAARIVLALLRTLPALLWAIIFVIIVGPGPLAGVLAIIMYTIGYMGKLQYEAIEGIDPEALQAVTATGANKLQIVKFVAIPESANNIISQLLFMFEYNIRSSTILGFVGAGGIGFYIASYLKFLEYNSVLTLLLLIFLLVLLIDWMSNKIRDRYLVKSTL